MKITELQLQQLKDLNDSKVNEILGIRNLEDNTWYIYEDKSIQFNKKNGEGYGYSKISGWNEDCKWLEHNCNGEYKKATHEEVQTALIEEAKRRGFYNIGGLNFITIKGVEAKKGYFITADNEYLFSVYENTLTIDGVVIFKNGKWLEVISNPVQERINKLEQELNELKKSL